VAIVAGGVLGEEPEAPLVAAMARNHVRSGVQRGGRPKEVLRAVNGLMVQELDGRLFVAVMVGVLDLARLTLDVARAGLSAPLLINAARPQPLAVLHTEGMVIGIDKGPIFDSSLDERSFPLQEDDLLVVFTTGLVEARGAGREEFGVERVHALARRYGTHEVDYFSDKLRECYEAFAPDPTQRATDVAMLALKLGSPPR
jgi:phosphoserine phosphatase RsbU/P